MSTFISYSRRQLYFAESLALRLQNEGIDVWFDLQQLQAGKVWSDGLDHGIGGAGQLVLIVSKASLESAYTREEWRGVAARGRPVVLVIYESIELPDELLGLPTYDFRGRFDSRFRELTAFLKGDGAPQHDRVPRPNRFGLNLKLPGALWCAVCALFSTLVAGLLGLVFTLIQTNIWHAVPTETGPLLSTPQFFLGMMSLSLATGMWYAVPLIRHRLPYGKLKRGVVSAAVLLVPGFLAVVPEYVAPTVPQYLVLLALLFTAFVYIFVLRRSGALLRWMQPEEALQNLRRRVHQPLVSKSAFDVDTATKGTGKGVTYTIHADAADAPLARSVDATFRKAGHVPVTANENPAQHVAVLSNRSSKAWVNEITRTHAGRLIFVVVSTVEFNESLTEAGRYQWVDARDGAGRDVDALARSLGDREAMKREVALETTPAVIDRWKVPAGITLLKRLTEILGICLLVFGLTDLVGYIMALSAGGSDANEGGAARSIFLIFTGATCFWLASIAFIYRRVTGPVIYGFLIGSIFLVSWLPQVLEGMNWKTILPAFLSEPWWLMPAITTPLLLYTALGSYSWLPGSAKVNSDEIGIKRSIHRAFKRKNVSIVLAWFILIVGYVVFMLTRTN